MLSQFDSNAAKEQKKVFETSVKIKTPRFYDMVIKNEGKSI